MTPSERKPVSLGRVLLVSAAASLALGISGCAGFKESIGAGKQTPDETSVVTRAPLVVPASFDLKTPTPGAPRPQDADTAGAAQRVLGGTPKSTPATEGEKALLAQSGAVGADPKVRQELRQEVIQSSKRKSYADTVLFWRGTQDGDTGTPLNAGQESARINASMPASGVQPGIVQAAPVIEKAEVPVEQTSVETVEAEKKEESDNDKSSGGWFDWF